MESIYKIYNDGSHYVGTLIMPKRKSDVRCKRVDTVYDYLFDYLYLDSLDKGYKRESQHNYIVGEFIKHYPDYGNDRADKFVGYKIEKKIANLHSRYRRFKRKANMNNWNYMVTITYDGKMHNEDSFRKKLKKCFANLHTRRGWNFMGAFERSPDKRRLYIYKGACNALQPILLAKNLIKMAVKTRDIILFTANDLGKLLGINEKHHTKKARCFYSVKISCH